MKQITFLVLILISNFVITPSYATRFETSVSWTQLGNGSAVIEYSSDYSDETKIFTAQITHSNSGYQRLYFSDYYAEDTNVCTYRTTTPDSITMIFNGQAVKMLRWCQKFTDTEQYYFNLTPETDRGDSYIINLFKTATSPIKIQYNNETFYFPVTGFTKAWNSAGGNAI
ncbi:hypothetical protein [Psychrobacter urativorans]|nr:hypothetical protein [Psychrobacter urativorans]